MYEIEVYTTESGRCPVKEYLGELAKGGNQKEITQIKLFIKRLEGYGPGVNDAYPETIRKLTDEIWELRPGKNRVFFCTFTGKKVVLLHAYRKFKQKTPPNEIGKAEQERNDYIRRKDHERH